MLYVDAFHDLHVPMCFPWWLTFMDNSVLSVDSFKRYVNTDCQGFDRNGCIVRNWIALPENR